MPKAVPRAFWLCLAKQSVQSVRRRVNEGVRPLVDRRMLRSARIASGEAMVVGVGEERRGRASGGAREEAKRLSRRYVCALGTLRQPHVQAICTDSPAMAGSADWKGFGAARPDFEAPPPRQNSPGDGKAGSHARVLNSPPHMQG